MWKNFAPMIFPAQIVDHEYDAVINKEKKEGFRLSQIQTKYIVLVMYPMDFTFVCPTEIIKFSSMNKQFLDEDATIVFSSGDSVFSHLTWINKKVEDNGIGNICCPMISDLRHKLSSQFNLFNENAGTVMRATVILDNKFNVKHISANIDPIGRSTLETLRLVKAIKFYDEHGEICPVDFQKNKQA